MILKIEQLSKTVHSAKGVVDILSDVSLDVRAGEVVSIFGPNGCGKTTLLNIIADLDSLTSGNIEWTSVNSPTYVFQDYRASLLPWFSLKKNILLPSTWRGSNLAAAEIELVELMKILDIDLNLKSYPLNISGGQAQMVCLLRAMLGKPNLVLLDEPTSALDYSVQWDWLFTFEKMRELFNTAAIFISHDPDQAILASDKIVMLSKRPASITEVISVDLPRPRGIDILTSRKFIEIKTRVLANVKKHF